jgi:hypothetical protein
MRSVAMLVKDNYYFCFVYDESRAVYQHKLCMQFYVDKIGYLRVSWRWQVLGYCRESSQGRTLVLT